MKETLKHPDVILGLRIDIKMLFKVVLRKLRLFDCLFVCLLASRCWKLMAVSHGP